jgi:uncharacterized DUF497 family protein
MYIDDDFEWDENKDDENLDKHEYSFEQAKLIWDGMTLEFQDPRPYKEIRYIAVGYLDASTILFVVYTWRGRRRRIISAREAEPHEAKKFQDYRRSRKRR